MEWYIAKIFSHTLNDGLPTPIKAAEETVAHFRALNPDPASTPPGRAPFWTHGESLKYAVFHARLVPRRV